MGEPTCATCRWWRKIHPHVGAPDDTYGEYSGFCVAGLPKGLHGHPPQTHAYSGCSRHETRHPAPSPSPASQRAFDRKPRRVRQERRGM